MVTRNRGGSTTIIGQEICVSLIPHDRWRTFREPLFGGYPDVCTSKMDENEMLTALLVVHQVT